VHRELVERMLAAGHERSNFAIVAAGAHAASPHHEPSAQRTIVDGDLVLCDFGGTMQGYCSDITRMFHVGEPPTEVQDVYAVLAEAQEAGVRASTVGTPCEEVDAAARRIIAAAGFGDQFIHRVGHGIGTEAHEDPYMVAGNGTVLEAGHAFSVEPGIYFASRFGMRLEDIVVATDDFTRELGMKWGVQALHTTSGGNVITTAPLGGATGAASLAIERANNNNGASNASGMTTYQTGSGGFNVNLPVATPAGQLGLAILGRNYMVDLELSAAQTEGRGEVVSSPRVITANQQEAVIRQGQEIGYVTFQNSGGQGAGSGTATVQFKDAVLELKVTPTITADNRVYLAINVKKDALAGYVDAPGSGKIPTIDTREINTSVLVDNGQTVVLGGIFEVNKSNTVVKVPGLGDIPGIGALFRKTTRNDTKAELLIFVTPRILSDSLQ